MTKPCPHQANNLCHCRRKQCGAALMVMLVIMIIGSIAFLVSSLSSSALQIGRDKKTAAALAQAKEALIGYAVKVQISSSNFPNQPRPGDLPCPDINNDGSADTPCSGNALGRLPWKTLGLPDLRDSSGERLWYAVSANFKNSPRSGTLNSDTTGTISVFAPDGTLLNDGGGSTGAVAVIIAPGDVLQRTDKTTPQDRSSAGSNDPLNYLEVFNDYLDKINGNYPHTLINEDNANFSDGSSTIGFIQGKIKFRSGLPSDSDRLIVNDQLLVVTQDNIMQAIQKRVAGEVKQCLIEYASNNNGRYPWAVPLTDLTNYNDSSGLTFGRIPDDLGHTNTDSFGVMSDKWGIMCNTDNNNFPATWWLNWREMVFYGLASAYKPAWYWWPPSCPTCLSVNPPSATADKQFVVLVAGKKIGLQVRNSNADKSTLSNYLEGANADGASPFAQGQPSTTFNDTVVFQ